jgi:ketosteroid isomerase-like protein
MAREQDRIEVARSLYRAFAAGERERVEELLAPGFAFHSPADPELDRDGYFERCWPNSDNIRDFDLVRAIESGAEVVVTYEATRADGTRFRNTEVLAVEDGQVTRAEVYFGWDLS